MSKAMSQDISWQLLIEHEQKAPYFIKLQQTIQAERDKGLVVLPREEEVFYAFEATPFERVKVVILGQDPYYHQGQAHGLAFSVKKGVAIPPSLTNIYRELEVDIPEFRRPNHGYLDAWARQGVLLLNSTLTVTEGKPNSHENFGWDTFTSNMLRALNDYREDLVFILWGSFAQRKGRHIDRARHLVLQSPHPSPLSAYRGFFGRRHFSLANQYLSERQQAPICWQLGQD